MDPDCRTSNPNTVGFYLLPTELLHAILLRLCIPEIIHLKSVSKCIFSTVSDQSFVRVCNSRSESTSWLFVFTKRWRRDGILHGFSDRSDRWFKIPIIGLLKQVIYPGEDFYFLTASGNFFLFASDYYLGIIAVDLVKKSVRRIPSCPLGPRGTSSLRRSGMKLLTGPVGSVHFRFLFAETVDNRPVIFEYDSVTDTWRSEEAEENRAHKGSNQVFLNVSNGPYESTVIAAGEKRPVILRPRFNRGAIGGRRLAVGFSRGDLDNHLLIHGDGFVTIVRSESTESGSKQITTVELYGMINGNGEKWEIISRVPNDLISKIKKPCGVMMGCLERRLSVIRVVLVSNLEGLWDIIWINYCLEKGIWEWKLVPDCKFAKGSNMAGITFSSGLTLS